MALVFVAEASHGLAIRHTQPTRGSFQGLDVGLLNNTDHHGVFRWVKVQSHDISCLPGKLGIGADAPASATVRMDPALAHHPPDMVGGHIPESLGQQLPRPSHISGRRRGIQLRQYPPFSSLIVLRRLAGPGAILQARHPATAEAGPPFADCGLTHVKAGSDLPRRLSRRALQHDAASLYYALFHSTFPQPGLKLTASFCGQLNATCSTRGVGISHNEYYCSQVLERRFCQVRASFPPPVIMTVSSTHASSDACW